MDDILKQLLNALDAVGAENEEVYDSEVREQMSNAVFDGFIRPVEDFTLPEAFGMHSESANLQVKRSLEAYIAAANAKAAELGLSSFHERLSAFQNSDIESDDEGTFYDDFFGYSPADAFDPDGNVIEAQ